ncbi:MAG: PAS domain S-box protein, partial [Gallionella sp.]|nr:PAS domain S-box protein [Gallionella sp.]
GKPLRSRGTVQDISELRQAELAAQESATRTQTILDNVLDGIITISDRGIVESFNKSSEKIFGYAADEVIGNNVKMLMPDPYHSQHDGYLHNYTSTGTKKIIGIGRQVVGKRKDGSTFPMDLAVSEMRLGEKRMFTGIVRDITERVKIERMKSEFISTVSHELRTPLTSIRGSLGLIAGGITGELPVQAKAMLDIAHKNSERLILLVNDILDMEKIEAGKMEFQAAPIKLTPLLKQALDANRSYADQYKVTYKLENEMPEVMIHADTNRLLQVLANLLSNAAKFSPPDGDVIVNMILSDKHVRVGITDRGSGIPEQFRSQIFQKFAQADSSDTRKKGGTGLGLSITKAIVEQMGGHIGFDSTPDVMTTFFIEFPLWHETALPATHTDNSHQPKVLIVEDDRDVAVLLHMMLDKAGIASDIAYDAAQAKQFLSRSHYAAMTLDLALPDQDGISLIRELRSKRETEKLPIVVVSAKTVEGRKELNGDAFTVLDWISKPINQSQLVSSLQHALEAVSSERSKVLHVEDDPDVYSVVHTIVGNLADLDHARNLADARRMLGSTRYDLVILDITLPDGMGMELLPSLNAASPPIPVLVFSAQELGRDEVKKVQSALVKSRTDNAQLLDIIKKLIK